MARGSVFTVALETPLRPVLPSAADVTIKRLIERAVRDSQADFAAILEQKLSVLLAGEDAAPVTLHYVPASAQPSTGPRRQRTKRSTPTTNPQRSAKAARPPTDATAERRVVTDDGLHVTTARVLVVEDTGDFEIDLPILRAVSNGDPIMVVGREVDPRVIVDLRTLTGLAVEPAIVTPETLDAVVASVVERASDKHVLGIVVVATSTALPEMTDLVAAGRGLGVPIVRSSDGALVSLLSALDALERLASGSSICA